MPVWNKERRLANPGPATTRNPSYHGCSAHGALRILITANKGERWPML